MENVPERFGKDIESGNIHFDRRKNTLLLSLDASDLDLVSFEKLRDSEKLLEKKEFHVTVLGYKAGGEIAKELQGRADREQVTKEIENLAQSTKWHLETKPEYYIISKKYGEEERRSCIQIIELAGLEGFYEKLNEILGTDFELPFPHVTVLTNSTVESNRLAGIGLSSREDFEKCSPRRVEL